MASHIITSVPVHLLCVYGTSSAELSLGEDCASVFGLDKHHFLHLIPGLCFLRDSDGGLKELRNVLDEMRRYNHH